MREEARGTGGGAWRERSACRALGATLTLLVLSFLAAGPASAALCGLSGRPCTVDAQCCPGLVCGPARSCQIACKIHRALVKPGTRDPSNPCQACQPSRSTSGWTPLSDGTSCSDQNACTDGDLCFAGACMGGAVPDCGDGNPCTADSCDPLAGCVHDAVGCDDGNPCTTDSCDPATGACVSFPGGSACDDGNPCTEDACDPVAGCSHSPAAAGPCDDGNACTTQDACEAGWCVGGPPPPCDDENPCTADWCNPASGCLHDGGPVLEPQARGAFLVFPLVLTATDPQPAGIETIVSIRNTSSRSVVAHVAFLNGDSNDPAYCYECDFDLSLMGWDTETLIFSRVGSLTRIRNVDTGATRSCAARMGFVTVNVENARHEVRTDNILTGSAVVVDYPAGSTFSVPALPVQGGTGDLNRAFAFDGVEYRKFPPSVESEFAPPDFAGPARTHLILFTLAFQRQFPPLTDCSVIGRALPSGSEFSNSLQFGCWTAVGLQDIDPEFARPYLDGDRGWLRLRCDVYGTGENGLVEGGVHGALIEWDGAGGAGGRLLDQAPTGGCPMTLRLGEPVRSWR